MGKWHKSGYLVFKLKRRQFEYKFLKQQIVLKKAIFQTVLIINLPITLSLSLSSHFYYGCYNVLKGNSHSSKQGDNFLSKGS